MSSRRVLLRSLGLSCLGLLAVLVAGGAAGMFPASLNCPLTLRRTHPLTLVCCSQRTTRVALPFAMLFIVVSEAYAILAAKGGANRISICFEDKVTS